MELFPLPLANILGHWGAYAVYLLIGVAFGYILEISGFGNSRILAAQFYFKNMTVLKVMFTAIVVAMVLIFLATAVGLLDYNLIWVNPTYLWPGIVGGLVMGVGFIIGGFCPGTALVATATLKLDGLMFTLGALFGIFLFGETVGFYEDWWYSSDLGRFTIQDMLGVDAGIVVLGVVIMALVAFWFAEQGERIFGGMNLANAPKWRYAAAGGLVGLAAVVMVIGQPDIETRWQRIASDKQPLLDARDVQIHPGEMLDLIGNDRINVLMLDVRNEADYNQFHIQDAKHVDLEDLPALIPELRLKPANTVTVVMSNDEAAATEAWKNLVAGSVINVYILENGINGWLATFSEPEFLAEHPPIPGAAPDHLAYYFNTALGDRYIFAKPDPAHYELTYESKVVLQVKRGASGGCG
jgi:rhodanese-related sulfurtransferase